MKPISGSAKELTSVTELTFIRGDAGIYPADTPSQDYVSKLKLGERIHADFKRQRNPQFHRKFFALLQIAFDLWEPGELTNQYGTVEKNFDQFRKDLIILAGFYEQDFRLDGSVRINAKSIRFGHMDEDEFAELYSRMIDVILKHICRNRTKEDLQNAVEQVLGFA